MNKFTKENLKRLFAEQFSKLDFDSEMTYCVTIRDGASLSIEALGYTDEDGKYHWGISFWREWDANGFFAFWDHLPSADEQLEVFDMDFSGENVIPSKLVITTFADLKTFL